MKNYDKFYAVMSLIQGDKVLINEVRKYPYIYNQKHEHYKDTKLKDQTWQTIGEAINVKRKYKSIIIYSRFRKTNPPVS